MRFEMQVPLSCQLHVTWSIVRVNRAHFWLDAQQPMVVVLLDQVTPSSLLLEIQPSVGFHFFLWTSRAVDTRTTRSSFLQSRTTSTVVQHPLTDAVSQGLRGSKGD